MNGYTYFDERKFNTMRPLQRLLTVSRFGVPGMTVRGSCTIRSACVLAAVIRPPIGFPVLRRLRLSKRHIGRQHSRSLRRTEVLVVDVKKPPPDHLVQW